MTCNHIIGLASGGDYEDTWTANVQADLAPESWMESFDPYAFCPKCGASVADEAQAYQALLDALEAKHKAEESARPKTPVDEAFERESTLLAHSFIKAANQPRISTLIQKQPLPKGMGYNWQSTTNQKTNDTTTRPHHRP